MKCILFTGTWRLVNKEVENDVRACVQEVLSHGDGIVTGFATGVDYFAAEESMKLFPDGSRLKTILPATLDQYIYDYHKNWCTAPITKYDIEKVNTLLQSIKAINPGVIAEMYHDDEMILQEDYDDRNTEMLKIAHGVCAFQVNDSVGTQDAINKASKSGIPIIIHKKY